VADVAGVLGGRALAPNACCEGEIAVEERHRPTAVIAATRVAGPGRDGIIRIKRIKKNEVEADVSPRANGDFPRR
jgi:hypothetical protein